ncbi:PTS glucose transporter subunit IIA [Actinomyces israelii]|uniref:PTS glucose transporter subunit IIA n=1 Tax=Actinomyces israelii TaxID=1659 RepID=A0ABT4IB93_9ACTO|nr:PTS glucose transporter subunit IIA [Actinomyces israelii]MCZ0859010.1 PTS glucose transporter subunit IIA [Actinomyces israelii]
MILTVRAPLSGTVVAIEDVPDPVFSGRLVGPGLAIDPDREAGAPVTAVAPISGTLSKIRPHAYVVVAPGGRGVLVHLGLDTVQLGGRGFTLHAAEGDPVAVGDPVVTWSPADVEAGGRSPIVPVVALDAEEGALTTARAGQTLASGAVACTWS